MGRRNGDDALMGQTFDEAVEGFARLKADGDAGGTAKIDDLLQTRAGGTLDEVNAIHGLAGAQRFAHRMDASDERHGTMVARVTGTRTK
jgi:hypothetical protein